MNIEQSVDWDKVLSCMADDIIYMILAYAVSLYSACGWEPAF